MRLGYLEVFGYGEAARWVYAQAVEPGDWIGDAFLTVTEVPHAHHVAMSKVWEVAPHLDAGPDDGPGAFRRHDIHAFSGGMTPPAWGDVAAEVQRWAEIVDTFGTAVRSARVAAQDIPAELARLHCEFERIHPFVDGNGPAGRLLLNLVLEHCRPRPSRSTALLGEQRRLLRRATAGGASGRLEAELSSDGTWRSSQHAVRVYLEGRHRGDPAR